MRIAAVSNSIPQGPRSALILSMKNSSAFRFWAPAVLLSATGLARFFHASLLRPDSRANSQPAHAAAAHAQRQRRRCSTAPTSLNCAAAWTWPRSAGSRCCFQTRTIPRRWADLARAAKMGGDVKLVESPILIACARSTRTTPALRARSRSRHAGSHRTLSCSRPDGSRSRASTRRAMNDLPAALWRSATGRAIRLWRITRPKRRPKTVVRTRSRACVD